MKIETRLYETMNIQSRKSRVKTRYVWVTLKFSTGLLNNDLKISRNN